MKYYSIILCCLLLSACGGNKNQVYSLEKENASRIGLVAVTVKDFKGLDGCSFLLVLNDSMRYEPVNLADSLMTDDLKLWIRFKTVSDHMSICMAGQAINITEAQYRSQ